MQVKAAEGGNASMLIWLGKQLLSQKDKNEVTGKDGAPLIPPENINVIDKARWIAFQLAQGIEEQEKEAE